MLKGVYYLPTLKNLTVPWYLFYGYLYLGMARRQDIEMKSATGIFSQSCTMQNLI